MGFVGARVGTAIGGMALLLGGCGEAGTAVVVRDSAGVEVVVSRRPAWSGGERWQASRSPVLSVASHDDEGNRRMYRPGDALRLEDGRIVVENSGMWELLIVGPDGEILEEIGGHGPEPGRFMRLAGIDVAGDTVFAFDSDLGRISAFGLDGGLRGTVPIVPVGGPDVPIGRYRMAGRARDGSVVFAPDLRPGRGREPAAVYWDSLPHLLAGLDGAVRDTIGSFGGLELFATPSFSVLAPFARRSVADVRDDRFAVGRSFDWSLELFDTRGRLRRVIRREETPPPVTGEQAERAVEERLRGIEVEETRRAIRERFEGVEFPERWPAYAHLTLGRDGTLWVRAYRPAWESGPERWSVFGGDGRWLGDVWLPEGFRVSDVGEDWLLGVRRERLGEERVEMWGLERR